MSIFVSTGAFKSKDIEVILDWADKIKLYNIELAPGLSVNDRILDIIEDKKNDFNFLIHNYFPTPKEPFALNLASQDEKIAYKSMDMCIKAVDICAEMGIPHYSVHCGFCFDTNGKDLGKKSQIALGRTSKKVAYGCFIHRLKELCVYAKKKQIELLIENNVAAGFTRGTRDILLGVDSEDITSIMNDVDNDNLGFLMDLAHAKVSANSYGFDIETFIRETMKYVREVHISENDGFLDQNQCIKRDSDMLKWLSNYRDKIITLEAYELSLDEIEDQIKILRDVVG